MKERKYKEDYELKTQWDETTGREKRVSVYRGKWFLLPDRAKTDARNAAVCALLWWAFVLLYLFAGSPSTYHMSVLLPAICATLPGAYWVMGVVSLLRCPARHTTLQRETGAGRVFRSAAACLVLSGLSALADALFMLRAAALAAELLPFALLCSAAIIALACARRAKALLSAIREDVA